MKYGIISVFFFKFNNKRSGNIFLQKPPVLNLDKELNFFDNETVHPSLSEYDLFFSNTRICPLWDKRKLRENRQYLPDLRERIFQQASVNFTGL